MRKWCYVLRKSPYSSIFGLRTNVQFKSNQKLKNVKMQFLLKSAYTLIHKECNLRIFFVKWQCALRCTHFIVLAFTEIYIKDHYANGKCLFASLVCIPMFNLKCWTEDRRSTAVAEDFRPTAMSMVAEVWGHSYGHR